MSINEQKDPNVITGPAAPKEF